MRSRRISLVKFAMLGVFASGGLTAGAILGASSPSATADTSATQAQIEQVIVQADNLIQNQSVPTPQGVTTTDWELSGDAASTSLPSLLSDPEAQSLSSPERNWISPSGAFLPLPSADAEAIIARQDAEASQLFTGAILGRVESAIDNLTTAEESNPDFINSPGGAAITSWGPIEITGSTATAQGTEETWKQVDRAFPEQNSTYSLSSQMASDSGPEYVTLQQNSTGQWQVTFMNTDFGFKG